MRREKWAGIKRTSKFLYVAAESGRFGVATDRAAFSRFLPVDAAPAELGAAIRMALRESRYFEDDDELRAFFDYDRLGQETRQWEEEAVTLYGYKLGAALYSPMHDVRVVLAGTDIVMHPTRQHAHGWTREGVADTDSRTTSTDTTDQEIGRIALDALDRCT